MKISTKFWSNFWPIWIVFQNFGLNFKKFQKMIYFKKFRKSFQSFFILISFRKPMETNPPNKISQHPALNNSNDQDIFPSVKLLAVYFETLQMKYLGPKLFPLNWNFSKLIITEPVMGIVNMHFGSRQMSMDLVHCWRQY